MAATQQHATRQRRVKRVVAQRGGQGVLGRRCSGLALTGTTVKQMIIHECHVMDVGEPDSSSAFLESPPSVTSPSPFDGSSTSTFVSLPVSSTDDAIAPPVDPVESARGPSVVRYLDGSTPNRSSVTRTRTKSNRKASGVVFPETPFAEALGASQKTPLML